MDTISIGVGGGGSGGAAAPPDLGQMANFWAQEAIFGHSWHAQKLLNCPKIAKLPKNFRAAKLQPPQFDALHYTYEFSGVTPKMTTTLIHLCVTSVTMKLLLD